MNRLRRLMSCAASSLILAAATAAMGQLPLSSDVDLFGDGLPQAVPTPGRDKTFFFTSGKSKKTEDQSQILVFRDGRQLHGELVEVSANGIVWRRTDTGEPLHFPRDAVRRIVLDDAALESQNPMGFAAAMAGPQAGVDTDDAQPNGSSRPSRPIPATLKLPGGDWLFGEVSSADGEKFTVRLGEKTTVNLSRSALEWLHFSSQPAPAFGFFGSALDLEGWMPESAATEVVGGTAAIGGGNGETWIGRGMTAPRRFEVKVDVPSDVEDGTRLWLQPIGPQVNCFTAGTVQLEFGKTQIHRLLMTNQFEPSISVYPKEARDAPDRKGPTNYRVFYDGIARRIVVLRNGKTVGDWKFKSEKGGEEAEAMFRQVRITGICLDRFNGNDHKKLEFSRLEVQPWNGIVPDSGEASSSEDRLFFGDAAPIRGKLDSIADGKITFSGESRDNKASAFIQFANSPEALPEPIAKVSLGKAGEFNVSKLELREGTVRCDTAFATGLEVPSQTVQAISFQNRPATQEPSADVLVFKNGDEIPGQALAASSQGAVRWKTFSGQELEMESKWIAGIRLATGAGAPPARPVSTVELRDGERLCGDLVALDEKQIRLQHPHLGALVLDRNQLWHLFPNPTPGIADGGDDPGAWMRRPPTERGGANRPNKQEPAAWIYLDGTYVRRLAGAAMSPDPEDWDGLHREIPAGLDRFEVRLEAYSVVANSTCMMMRLSTQNGGPTWQATIAYDDLQLMCSSGEQNGGRSDWRQIPLQEKLANLDTRRAIRLFVDTKSGTSDLFLNGVLVAHLGQLTGERLPPGKYTVHLQPYPNQGPCLISNLWIGPWTGDLPRNGTTPSATTAFDNGDSVAGTPKAMHDGKMDMEGEIGAFEIPVEKVQEVDFGGNASPDRPATRLRLSDGSVVHVDQYQWDGQALTAHSPTLGDLHLPTGVVNEIIFHPPALHTLVASDARKPATHDPKASAP